MYNINAPKHGKRVKFKTGERDERFIYFSHISLSELQCNHRNTWNIQFAILENYIDANLT